MEVDKNPHSEMLHVESSYSEFEERFEEAKGDSEALEKLYDRTKNRTNSLWNDYRKTHSSEIREEYENFKDLLHRVRKSLIYATFN